MSSKIDKEVKSDEAYSRTKTILNENMQRLHVWLKPYWKNVLKGLSLKKYIMKLLRSKEAENKKKSQVRKSNLSNF